MKFSCALPIDFTDDKVEFSSIDAIKKMTRAMENAGLDATYVTDHPAPSSRWLAGGGHPTLDPFVALAVAAAATKTLQLQTHVLVLAYRNPFVVAKSAASLDALSGGRFIMGIGTGYSKPEYAALGVEFEDRGEITTESLKIMQQAWAGEIVHHESARFFARDTVIRPLPARKGGIAVWGGGNARPAIRRAVELCDGWSPFPSQGILTKTARTEDLASYEQLQEKLDFAREYGEAIGRTKPLTICMTPLENVEGKPQDPAYAQKLVDAYGKSEEMGVHWATMGVPHPSLPAFLENVHWFGEEVAAKLK
ncbi:MAG: TIGR03619 family F420-dependent LLM class oxidoreductase [Sphingomonadaceae bacterium]|nr:TIGR03619 family F420-dependent LLM class oxidoreductase [Sphingomonadaceae bacterium]